MKQKYHILKRMRKRELVIQEYAVIQSDSRRKENSVIQKDDFSLLCEETYDLRDIKSTISKGKTELISKLRTHHFFPIGLCIDKIADKVANMLALKGDQSAEIVFDDRDSFLGNQDDSDIMGQEEVEMEEKQEIDEILQEDVKLNGSPASVDNENQESYDDEVEY